LVRCGRVLLRRLRSSALARTLYGADPSLWRVDNSFVTFRDGTRSASTFAASVVDAASFTERSAVSRDPTAGLLRHNAQRLGKHLPTAPGRMDEIAELMLWIRDARSSPPASRLVLCDRAIETVSGWVVVDACAGPTVDA